MAMTRAQMNTEVCNTIHRDPTSLARDGTSTLTTRVNTWLDWAQVRIARDASVLHHYEFSTLQYSTAVAFADGTATYALPTGTKNVYNIKVTTSAKSFYLIYKTPKEFDAMVPDPSNRTEGCPIFYTIWTKKFEVYPVPDATYASTCRHSKYPTAFATDASTSDLLNMDDLIVACTVAIAYEVLREVEDAAYWNGEYLKKLESSIRADRATTIPITELEGVTVPPKTGGA